VCLTPTYPHSRAGLFRLGSKLPHTCDPPNTAYICRGARGYHIALRAIQSGELLTTCYMDTWDRLLPTKMR